MIHDEEFDLTWSDDPPAWVYNFGPLLEFWGDPIFQRRYVLWRLKPSLGIARAFWIGFILSLLLNLLLVSKESSSEALGLGFFLTVILPSIIAFAFTGTRMFTMCLIGTPLELRRELYSGGLGSVLSAPLTDARIFIAECTSGLMRGMGAMEEILALIGGLIVPFLIVMHRQIFAQFSEAGILVLWWAVLGLIIIIIIIQLNVLTTFAAGLYAVLTPVSVAVPATLIHVWSAVLLCIAVPSFIIKALVDADVVHNPDPLAVALVITVFMVMGLTLAISVTVHFGIRAFACARRPGFYEPERATAGELLRREGPSGRTRYGQRI